MCPCRFAGTRRIPQEDERHKRVRSFETRVRALDDEEVGKMTHYFKWDRETTTEQTVRQG